MVDFNPEENMQSLDDETKQLIKEAIKKRILNLCLIVKV